MIEVPVLMPRELLELIDRAFLPKNPRKMRGAHPSVPAAVIEFRRILTDPVERLKAATVYVDAHHPLPRCEHGTALRDGGGEVLAPSCGCVLIAGKRNAAKGGE